MGIAVAIERLVLLGSVAQDLEKVENNFTVFSGVRDSIFCQIYTPAGLQILDLNVIFLVLVLN